MEQQPQQIMIICSYKNYTKFYHFVLMFCYIFTKYNLYRWFFSFLVLKLMRLVWEVFCFQVTQSVTANYSLYFCWIFSHKILSFKKSLILEVFCHQVMRDLSLCDIWSVCWTIVFMYNLVQIVRMDEKLRPTLLCLILFCQPDLAKYKNLQAWRIKYTSLVCSYILQNQAGERE